MSLKEKPDSLGKKDLDDTANSQYDQIGKNLAISEQEKDKIKGSVATIDGEQYMAMEVYDNTEAGRKHAENRRNDIRAVSGFKSRVKIVPVGKYLAIYTHLDDVRIGSSHTSRLAG